MGSRRVRVMKKLDESKVRWIISQKRKGATNAYMAEIMNVSTRWVKMLCVRYRNTEVDKIAYPVPMGRPRDSLPDAGSTLRCSWPAGRTTSVQSACTSA